MDTINPLSPNWPKEAKHNSEITKLLEAGSKKFYPKHFGELVHEALTEEHDESPVQEPEKEEKSVKDEKKRRKITMLCPVCQHTEEYYLSVTSAEGGYHKMPLVAVSLDCPVCGDVPMYRADNSLVTALKLLNAAGIWTEYHCSECHVDHSKEYNVLGLPKYFSGPYIMVSHLMDHEEASLIETAKKFNQTAEATTQDALIDVEIHIDTTYHAATDHETVDRHQVTIYCYMKEPSMLHSMQCCRILASFVRMWIQDMNNGIIPSDRGVMLRNAANESWFDPCEDDK